MDKKQIALIGYHLMKALETNPENRYSDIIGIVPVKDDDDIVKILYSNKTFKAVNIGGDSEAAAISDIMRAIMK